MVSRDSAYAITATLAVAAGIAAGFSMLGSPARQRLMEADQRRVEDLQSIAAILRSQSVLPETIAQIPVVQRDPETGRPYEYRRKDDTHFELCASFATYNIADRAGPHFPLWRHPAGRYCYQLESRR